MIVFKFGGGILKSAESVKKLADILRLYNEEIVVVVSAFGKTTSKIENLLNYFIENNNLYKEVFQEISEFHLSLLKELNFHENDNIYNEISFLLDELKRFTEIKSDNFDKKYDNLVSFGELLSSKIISEYLNYNNIKNQYCDIRENIITNSNYRDAKVDWILTKENIIKNFTNKNHKIIVTQGFIASDKLGNTTSLGKEGSDFTASIIAYIINAKQVTFWKEVAGIYNADPAKFKNCVLLNKLSYRETVEQIYFGAKILHPKTIKPLQNKKIPVTVRSFFDTENEGTKILDISDLSDDFYPKVPIFIEKGNQILISVSPNDFSFIDENSLSKIFSISAQFGVKINLMQNSAISFSFCVNYDKRKIPNFISELKKEYGIRYNKNLHLVTVRHYNSDSLSEITKNKEILLVQKSRSTVRYILRDLQENQK